MQNAAFEIKTLSDISHMLLSQKTDVEYTTAINTFNDPVELI